MKIRFLDKETIINFDNLEIGNYFMKKDDTVLIVYEKTDSDKYFIVGQAGRGYFKIDKEGTPRLIKVYIKEIVIEKS